MMTRHLAPLGDHASSTPRKDGLNLLDSCRICVIGSSNRVSFANLMTPSKGYVLSCVFWRNVNADSDIWKEHRQDPVRQRKIGRLGKRKGIAFLKSVSKR